MLAPVADDIRLPIVKDFMQDKVTDAAVLACMEGACLGLQLVARTPRACSLVEMVSRRELPDEEYFEFMDAARRSRDKLQRFASETAALHAHEGRLFSELL